MALATAKIKEFRRIGHSLKPVVMVAGNGLSEAVLAELERALDDHELIKVKISGAERPVKKELAQAVCEQCGCELVQSIGNIILVYRAAKQPDPRLSNLLRHQRG